MDNDLDLDLLVAVNEGQNLLYINDGFLNFTAVILPDSYANPFSQTFSAAVVDVDLDGHLDIFLANYTNQ